MHTAVLKRQSAAPGPRRRWRHGDSTIAGGSIAAFPACRSCARSYMPVQSIDLGKLKSALRGKCPASCWDGVKGRPMGVWSTPRVAASADARSLSEPPTLDREGFALEKHRTSVADFYDPAAVEQVYYAEIAELLRRATGAAEVHVFDHTLRVEDEAKRRVHGTRLLVTVVHKRLHGAIGTAARARRPCARDGRTPSGRPVCNSECLTVVRSLARTLSSRCSRRPHGTPDRLCHR